MHPAGKMKGFADTLDSSSLCQGRNHPLRTSRRIEPIQTL